MTAAALGRTSVELNRSHLSSYGTSNVLSVAIFGMDFCRHPLENIKLLKHTMLNPRYQSSSGPLASAARVRSSR